MRESGYPDYFWIIYFFDEDEDISNVDRAKGFFIRDATRKTEFRFIYFKETRKAIYQIAKDRIYERTEDRRNRKRIL